MPEGLAFRRPIVEPAVESMPSLQRGTLARFGRKSAFTPKPAPATLLALSFHFSRSTRATMVQSAQRPIISASHDAARTRFSQVDVARNYPGAFRDHRRDRRERACLLAAIRSIPAGSHVLDLPCGSGRLTRLLLEAGFTVTGADVSPKMVELARQRYSSWRATSSNYASPAEFELRDVMNTGYSDGQFDGVICNRLFHHFNEQSTRRAALAELRRICSGVLIVSFFNSFALDALRFRLAHMVRRTVPNDRVPIPYRSFASDVEAAGLRIRHSIAKQWGISPMWYLVMERA